MSEINEIKLEDLGESFFKDLRDSNFILVLGAGFSYGIPNKAGGTIPIGDDFAKITKKRFRDSSSIDYRSAAQVWRTQIRKIPSLIDEFKNLFLVDESKFDFKLYSSIFIPKWHNIFTLNFDDVLEMAQTSSPYKKLTAYAYPIQSSGDYDPNILHLHGLIEKNNNLESLVFTPESYLEFDTKLNTLYNVLHGDVRTLKKKILILGSQFKEDIILRKFFSELPADKSVSIYHFDIKNYNKNSDNFTIRNSTFVKLINKKGDKGTKVFLQLLLDNKHKIRNIELPGAITINRGFEENIQNGKSFSRSQFYSAKQEDNCQWYGILQGYDILREDYNKIKSEASKAFSTATISKVASVVHGTGGCGKSTLLRRLALELSKETEYEIIWVKDEELENFVTNAITKIQVDNESKYLIFVEDWYRLIGENKEIGYNLLKAVRSISNVRLIIGDRDIKGKDYLLNLINPKNLYELKAKENKIIISEIINKHPEWKEASEVVLKNEASYHASLFLILFAIAAVSENRIENSDIDLTDLENIIKRIAKYDLKKISFSDQKSEIKLYPGLAKALHYWSCVYDKYKIFFSYNTFLQLSDYYQSNNEISTYFTNWENENEVLNKLKLYINVSLSDRPTYRFQHIRLVQFNHDTLAEKVLSKVELEDWEPYDDIQKKKILNIVIEKGDDLTASSLLRTFLKNEKQIFISEQEMKLYIDKLFFEKENRDFVYMNSLLDLGLSSTELYRYISILTGEDRFHPFLWKSYFKIANDTEKALSANTILTHKDILSINSEVLRKALDQPGNKDEKIEVVKTILLDSNILNRRSDCVTKAFEYPGIREERIAAAKRILLDNNILIGNPAVIIKAFRQPDNTYEKREVAKKILKTKDLFSVQSQIIFLAFHEQGNYEEKKDAAKIILKQRDLSLHYDWFIGAFRQNGNKEEKLAAAAFILRQKDLLSIQYPILYEAFFQYGNDKEKLISAKRILNIKDILSYHYSYFTMAFKQTGNDALKLAVAKKILKHKDITSIQSEIVSAIFKFPGNDKEKLAVTKLILNYKDINSLHHILAVIAFKYPGNDKEKLECAKKILNYEEITSIQSEILGAVFNLQGNEDEKQAAAKRILRNKAILDVKQDIVVAAFQQNGNTEEKYSVAKLILEPSTWIQNKHTLVILESLRFYSKMKPDYDVYKERLIYILNSDPTTTNTRDPKLHILFFGLMGFALHHNQYWKIKTRYIIYNWDKIDRRGIYNVLQGYYSMPNEVYLVCKSILKNWETEITLPIMYTREFKYENHIISALGHPELKLIAKKTAVEIIKAKEDNYVNVPDSLLNIAKIIVGENIYPDWN